MYRPAQPGRNASYILTASAPSTFTDPFEPNVALEPANTPGMVRVYRREHPRAPWRPHGQIMDVDAKRLYCEPLRPDTSD